MEVYSISEVAQMSGQSQKKIRRYIAAEILKADKAGNSYRITKENYENWLTSNLYTEKDSIFNELIDGEKTFKSVNWADIKDCWVYDGWSDTDYRNGLNLLICFQGQVDLVADSRWPDLHRLLLWK